MLGGRHQAARLVRVGQSLSEFVRVRGEFEMDEDSIEEFVRSFEPREVFMPMVLVSAVFGFVWLLSWLVQGL